MVSKAFALRIVQILRRATGIVLVNTLSERPDLFD